MKSPSELDHYELLDVPRDATAEEIARAYRVAAATYEAGSLAIYSLYSEAEAEALRERIEHAYCQLSDVVARAAYDASLSGGGARRTPLELPFDLELSLEDSPRSELAAPGLDFEESPEEADVPYDGARLRRNRLQRGIEIDQIARITKVSPAYLRSIEEDRYERLPASVYVRGFVTAYARCLGLDPARVVPDYLERFEAGRPPAAASPVGEMPRRTVVGRRARR